MTAFLVAWRTRPTAPTEVEDAFQALASHAAAGSAVADDGTVFLGYHATVRPRGMEGALRVVQHDRLAIAGDVRIANREEVARALRLSQVPDDHTLALCAYRHWGREAATRLVGEFALAVHDAGAGTLWLARDALGVRPLYYALLGDRILAGSEMDALRRVPGFPFALNEAWIAEGFRPERRGNELPPLAALRHLPPAHELLLDADGGGASRRYWRPNPRAADGIQTREECAARLRALIVQAVESAVEEPGVACQLSGGLDSSTVALIASRALAARGERLAAYGLTLPEGAGGTILDERAFMSAVAEAGDIDLRHVQMPRRVPLSQRPPLANQQEAGFLGDAIAARAAADGHRVVLSGFGGDEFASFNARGLEASWLRRGRWVRAALEARASARRSGRRLWVLSLLPPMRQALPGGGRYPDAWEDVRHLLRPDFRERHRLHHPGRTRRLPDPRANQEKLLTIGHCAVRAVRDSTAAARHGVEFRFPLLDRRLVEFAMAVPPEYQLQDGYPRALFRAAIDGLVPPVVQWRTRKGFPNPWGSEALREPTLRLLDRVSALPRGGLASQYFDLDGIEEKLREIDRAWPPLGTRPPQRLTRARSRIQVMVADAEVLTWIEAEKARTAPDALAPRA